jgi:hypothetical protein
MRKFDGHHFVKHKYEGRERDFQAFKKINGKIKGKEEARWRDW